MINLKLLVKEDLCYLEYIFILLKLCFHTWLHMLWHRLAVNVSSKSPLSSVGSDGIRTQGPSNGGTKSPCIHRNRVSYQSRHWDLHKNVGPSDGFIWNTDTIYIIGHCCKIWLQDFYYIVLLRCVKDTV